MSMVSPDLRDKNQQSHVSVSSEVRFLRRKARSVAQAVDHKAGPIAASFAMSWPSECYPFPLVVSTEEVTYAMGARRKRRA